MKESKENTEKYTSLVKKADKLYINEEFDDAIELYLEAQKLKPNSIELCNKLGQAYCCIEEFGLAIENFKQAVEIRPQSAESYFNLGVAYDMIEQFQEAIEVYKKAAELEPSDADIFFNIGTDYDFLGKPEIALDFYEKALQIYPKMGEAAHNIGVIYIQKFTDLLLTKENPQKTKEFLLKAYSYFKNKGDFFEIINNFVFPQVKDNPELKKTYHQFIDILK